ncbi:MAG TPA: hypothetical protein PK987_11050 [Ferruginibacter sp.]|nr:hypothetical protein [Ferruginibacter sp.]
MKIILPVFLLIFFFTACNQADKSTKNNVAVADTVQQKFFPVTAFIKGEIYEMKKSGINPLQYTTQNNHTDSVWVKVEDIDSVINEFLHPVIDSTNLTGLFTEKSFLDQTINAITFTYEAKAPLPDSMKLRHWDVYIDPETQKVKRVYLVKEMNDGKMLQLTWISNQWCKITSITTNKNGESKVDKETKLTWAF